MMTAPLGLQTLLLFLLANMIVDALAATIAFVLAMGADGDDEDAAEEKANGESGMDSMVRRERASLFVVCLAAAALL